MRVFTHHLFRSDAWGIRIGAFYYGHEIKAEEKYFFNDINCKNLYKFDNNANSGC